MTEARQLEEAAAEGYQKFCDSAREYLPTSYFADWSILPDALKAAWKAAAKAINPSLR